MAPPAKRMVTAAASRCPHSAERRDSPSAYTRTTGPPAIQAMTSKSWMPVEISRSVHGL